MKTALFMYLISKHVFCSVLFCLKIACRRHSSGNTQHIRLKRCLYRCTVRYEVYLIYTNQLMHLYILFKKFKIYIKTLKTLLPFSILRSSSGSTYCSLLKLYSKTISDLLRYINLGDVAACL